MVYDIIPSQLGKISSATNPLNNHLGPFFTAHLNPKKRHIPRFCKETRRGISTHNHGHGSSQYLGMVWRLRDEKNSLKLTAISPLETGHPCRKFIQPLIFRIELLVSWKAYDFWKGQLNHSKKKAMVRIVRELRAHLFWVTHLLSVCFGYPPEV